MSGAVISGLLAGGTNVPSASRNFLDLVKSISEAQSKHEEDRIMAREAAQLKGKISKPDVSPRVMREYLVRLIYCEMLGQEVPYGYIHAVKLAQSTSVFEKRVGYLAVSLFLHPEHELMLLLINTLQRDLKSPNWLEVSSALTVVTKLISREMIPAIQSLVEAKLSDAKDTVRKKAVMAMHRFTIVDPTLAPHVIDHLRRALCDKHPSVMGAALHAFCDIAASNPISIKDLIPSFVSILKQTIEHRLGREYDYHSMPAPWIQIPLLQILASLGIDDQRNSEHMYEILSETLRRAEACSHAGYAVVYECMRTITSIYPNMPLIELAAKSAGRFLSAGNNNLRYLGITALAMIVQIAPSFATQHQMVVIECLDDRDETLKRKTLDLLYKMTNPHNVTVIVDKMISYLRSTVDVFLQTDLIARITQLTERYAPDNCWFIQTMNSIFDLGGDLVQPEVAHNLMRLVAEGTDDDAADKELRTYAVNAYAALLDRQRLPDILVHVTSWVLGEYAYQVDGLDRSLIIERLCGWLVREFKETSTRGWIITAITKLVAQTGPPSEHVRQQVEHFLASNSTDVQQRCLEFLALCDQPALMQAMLPVDSSCDDLEVDGSLSFLDKFVAGKLSQGAQRYLRPSERPVEVDPSAALVDLTSGKKASGLNFEPYERVQAPKAGAQSSPAVAALAALAHHGSQQPQLTQAQSALFAGMGGPAAAAATNQPALLIPGAAAPAVASSQPVAPAAPALNSELASSQRKMWSKTGYANKESPMAPPAAAPSASAAPQPTAAAQSHSQPSAVQAPTRHYEPPAPSAEDLRKQQLASALFGGVGASPATTRVVPSKTASGVSSPAAQSTPPISRQASSIAGASTPRNDLLLVDFDNLVLGQPTQPTQQPTQPTQSAMSSMMSAPAKGVTNDMLSFSSSSSSSSSTTGDKAASSSHGLAMFDGLDFQQPTQQAVPQHTTARTSLSSGGLFPAKSSSTAAVSGSVGLGRDLHGDLSLLGPSFATPASAPAPASLGATVPSSMGAAATAKPFVSNTLGQRSMSPLTTLGFDAPPPPAAANSAFSSSLLDSFAAPSTSSNSLEAKREVCADLNLSVAYYKVWKDDELSVVLYLSNKSSNNLADVQTKLDFPSNLQGAIDNASTSLSTDAAIRPGENVRHNVSLRFASPALQMVLGGTVTYRLPNLGPRSLTFQIGLPMSDFLRPLRITTAQFGQRVLQCAVRTQPELMERFRTQLNLHSVEIIGEWNVLWS
ncbi:epsilon-adaptin [Capsaspora owczarzaki ATCC 30864]|uniref:Epsilon-adaptin n=1 Tax=Capsaspora owczarzaki (strain ATCC 30864) TaxID=595528 RepID=A0A0D2UBG8_CAPO3|nr:epsilon-adaptin [Capsaspora owczarzaki ATCC 30864]